MTDRGEAKEILKDGGLNFNHTDYDEGQQLSTGDAWSRSRGFKLVVIAAVGIIIVLAVLFILALAAWISERSTTSEWQSSYEMCSQTVKTQSVTITSLTASLAAAKQTIASQNTQISDLNTQVTNLKSQLSSTQDALNSAKRSLLFWEIGTGATTCWGAVSTLFWYQKSKALGLCQESYSGCTKNYDICKNSLSDVTKNYDQCKTNYATCSSDLASYKSKYDECHSQETQCEADKTTCQTSLTETKGKLTTCTTDLDSTTKQLDTATKKLIATTDTSVDNKVFVVNGKTVTRQKCFDSAVDKFSREALKTKCPSDATKGTLIMITNSMTSFGFYTKMALPNNNDLLNDPNSFVFIQSSGTISTVKADKAASAFQFPADKYMFKIGDDEIRVVDSPTSTTTTTAETNPGSSFDTNKDPYFKTANSFDVSKVVVFQVTVA